MMSGVSYIALGLIACIFIVLVKQYRPEFAVVLSAVAACVILFLLLSEFSQFFTHIQSFIGTANNGINKYISIVMKVLALCIITQLAADICRDAGQGSIASKVELGGKLSCLVLSLPIFEDVLNLTFEIVG